MDQPTIASIPPEKSASDEMNGISGYAVVEEEKKDAGLVPNDGDSEEVPDTSNDEALAAALAQEDESEAAAQTNGTGGNKNLKVAAASSPWQYDDLHNQCQACNEKFHPLNRRHHCRLCGGIFCNNCSNQKALIPPSRIVLHPVGGKKSKPRPNSSEHVSFSPDPDPDRMLTYVGAVQDGGASNGAPTEQLLYGKGLEERFLLAREPIRVCGPCCTQLQPLQQELRGHNSHAMRFNYIDPTDVRRLFNSPIAFTLGHEIRKAAYTLNNLLPQPKRRPGAVISMGNEFSTKTDLQQCRDQCTTVSPNLVDLDGVKIPASLLEKAKGVAVLTVLKGGFGLAGAEIGTGLVVARLPGDGPGSFRWSAPSAIGTAGLAWGALIGAQVSDHVFLLMTDAAVALMFSNAASVQLGADIGVAVGPLGRALEGDWGVDGKAAAPIYTYSLSKGLYAGVSLDGKVIAARPNVNEKFYGYAVSAQEILAGAVPTPPAAQPLYEALQRCHVYATAAAAGPTKQQQQQPPEQHPEQHRQDMNLMGEYGEVAAPLPANNAFGGGGDRSVTGMSEITLDN